MDTLKKNRRFKFGILLFHAFCIPDNTKRQLHPYLYVDTKDFGKIIELFLENGIKFIDPLKLGTAQQQDEDSLWCLLTFDDGYFNNKYAVKVLEEYNTKVLLYCVREQIERQELFWWDVFYRYRIKEVPFNTLYDEIQELKKERAEDVKRLLKKRYGSEVFNADNNSDERIRLLTTQELIKMSEHPLVEIGVHGTSHKILTNYRDEDVNEELSHCKAFLEEVTGKGMKHLAYPNGNYNGTIISIADRLGFETAVTVKHGLNRVSAETSKKSWLELYRIQLPFPRVHTSIIDQAKNIVNIWKDEYAEGHHINI